METMVRYEIPHELSYTEEVTGSSPVAPNIEPLHPGVLIVFGFYAGI